MYQALLIKELRESAGLLAVAALAAVWALAALTGTSITPWQSHGGHSLPFVGGSLGFYLWLIGGGLAVLLGLKQTAWEAGWGTYYFLLHRPIDRWKVFGVKLAIGATIVLGVSGLLLLAYAVWASTPGAHDAPFFWSMTADAWWSWATLPVLYLAAFLSGIRPARWFGTKLAPLVAAMLVTLTIVESTWWFVAALAWAAWIAAALTGIFYYVRHRDY